jgi:hypothetical protein
MAKLKVFTSYSHRDSAIQLALHAALTKVECESRHDTGEYHTPELYKAISNNLNWCDVVVPIITPNWLASHECRDELVRANERRKIIIPFRHSAVSDDGPPKLPWYLAHNLSVLWHEQELQRAIDDILSRLHTLRDSAWQASCYRDLRVIGDDVHKSESTPTWKAALCQRVLQNAKVQLRNILVNDDCGFPVAHEQAYLRFAEPIFGRAKTIIAICIASISTFWTNPDFSNDAGTYLRNQDSSADSIMRLFVFDSVDELVRFRSILQKHHHAYGRELPSSGVFLCSTRSYGRLLKRWSLSSDFRALHQDFGLLSFRDGNSRMYATLDDREFHYTAYDEEDITLTTYRLIGEYFESLKTLQPGEFDSESGVSRWSPEWSDDDGQLTQAVAALFQDRHQPASHIVLIRPEANSPVVADYLRQLVVRFHKQRTALKIKSIALSQRCDLGITDRRYAAPLLTLQDFDYYLAMTFDDEDALRHYYQHELHSLERENLYIVLNPGVKPKFEEASLLPKRQIQERAALFSEIERAMQEGGYVMRIDALDDDSLVYLLSRVD